MRCFGQVIGVEKGKKVVPHVGSNTAISMNVRGFEESRA